MIITLMIIITNIIMRLGRKENVLVQAIWFACIYMRNKLALPSKYNTCDSNTWNV